MPFQYRILLLAVFATGYFVVPSTVLAQGAKPINAGEVLSGELTAMRNKRKKTITYQVTSVPRRLPSPGGLCNLETGPETFQIVTNGDADIASLKPYLGKQIALKANEISCASEAGQMTDAVVTKWSVVK